LTFSQGYYNSKCVKYVATLANITIRRKFPPVRLEGFLKTTLRRLTPSRKAMKTKGKLLTVASLVLGALISTTPLRAAVITMEDFSEVTSGTSLSSVPSWALSAGTNNAQVLGTVGYGGGSGATLNNVSLYRYAPPAVDTMTVSSLVSGYSVKVQMSSANNYQQAQILIGKNDGVNGLAVVFDGGTADTNSDNIIKISSGGTSWGTITYTSLPLVWAANDWYQVDFSNISLVSSGYGAAVTGYVTITDMSTSTVLLSNQLITGFGNSGTFNTIDSIVLGNKSSGRVYNFDDLTVTTIPEPSTLSLGGLALLGLLFRRRSIRTTSLS